MKFRVVIRMVNETVYEPYGEIAISLKTKLHQQLSLKEKTRVIDRNDVKDETNHFFCL